MRPALALLLSGALLVLDGPVGAQVTAMKGWELYSWSGAGEWRFSLLLGTNRTKGCAEIKSRAATKTLPELEAALAEVAHAPGEHVFWEPPGAANLADACDLAYPPADIRARITERVRRLQFIDLTCPRSSNCAVVE
jgi:hypothetical protein